MKVIKILFSLLLIIVSVILASCSEDLAEYDKGEKTLALSVNTKEVTLDIAQPQVDAVTFSWTAGTNHGTNAGISYQFQLAVAGTNFSKSVTLTLPKGSLSLKYKNAEFNSLLIDSLGVNPKLEVDLEVRVTATVLTPQEEKQISNVVALKATTYKPISNSLYLIGTAAPNGWNAGNATKMNSVSNAVGEFTWQGKLNAGELKFITTLGEFVPSYNKGADNTKLYFRESFDDTYDEKFVIPTTGIYKITLNLLALSINIQALNAPEYSELWFVGGFTGWSFVRMKSDPIDPFVFHYNEVLNSSNSTDEFKIGTQASFDNSVSFLRPQVDQQGAGKDLSVVKWSQNQNPSDHKWRIVPGPYKIRLDTRDMKVDIVRFTPYPTIYLVGDATPKGWDIGNATPMTSVAGDPYLFRWTGALKQGELKFSCDKQGDFNGAWFLAMSAGLEPSGSEEQMFFSEPGSNPDNKWKISTAGTYTIELNQLKETVKITKN